MQGMQGVQAFKGEGNVCKVCKVCKLLRGKETDAMYGRYASFSRREGEVGKVESTRLKLVVDEELRRHHDKAHGIDQADEGA